MGSESGSQIERWFRPSYLVILSNKLEVIDNGPHPSKTQCTESIRFLYFQRNPEMTHHDVE